VREAKGSASLWNEYFIQADQWTRTSGEILLYWTFIKGMKKSTGRTGGIEASEHFQGRRSTEVGTIMAQVHDSAEFMD
jgi:hypothetical protein